MVRKTLLLSVFLLTLKAENNINIQDGNKQVNIKQSSKELGHNIISLGSHNQNVTINQKISLIDNTNDLLVTIKNELKHALQNQNSIGEKFHMLLQKRMGTQTDKIEQLNRQFQAIIVEHQNTKDNINHLQKKIGQLITENNNEIKNLKNRLVRVETDIVYLMQELKNGNLASLFFYGLQVYGLYLDGTFYKGAAIEYERLFNSSMFDDTLSIVTNLSILTGTEETLIGDEEQQFYLFDIGVKKPFTDIDTSYHSYGKSSLGYLWGNENSLYIKLGIGIEKYNKKNKIALELNYLGILEKEETVINTHVLGNAQVHNKKKFQNAVGLTLNISFSGF